MAQNKSWQDMEQYVALVRRHNDNIFMKSGKTPVAFVRTFGCQQNVSDSEKLKGMLAAMGYAISDSPEGAEFVLFNTCAVRENAEERVFGNVGMLKAAKEQNPAMTIGLCGCMVQQPHITEKIRGHYPYVDLIFGTHAISRMPQLVWQRLSEGGKVTDIAEAEGGTEGLGEDLPTRRDGRYKAWVPIMYGCNNFCTYCVVPLVRGRERSRALDAIVAEVKGLVEDGYREVTLLGQNVNSYGKTLSPRVSFSRLLRELDGIPGDFRLRFMTSHPKDCTAELIDAIADCEKVCNHIHLPVQCGSDKILRDMNRGYTAADYRRLIDYARERIPDVAFTSDIIVGFPGETEADFEMTLALVEQVKYHSLFTFLYSPREGTKAAGLEDDTPQEIKSQRFTRLLELQRKTGRALFEEYVGQTLSVLTEGPGKTGEGRMTGKTEQGVIVEFDGAPSLTGAFVQVQITQAMQWALIGTLLHD